LVLGLFFSAAPAVSKDDTCFKNGQKLLKHNHFASLSLALAYKPRFLGLLKNLKLGVVGGGKFIR